MAVGNQLVLMKKGRARKEEDDCPICSLPLPLKAKYSSLRPCCTKMVCDGCFLAAKKRGMRDCPFCRAPTPETGSQVLAMMQKRVLAGDPLAIFHLGSQYEFGTLGSAKNVVRAVELYERAAELGVKEAHFFLGNLHLEGVDVEKDTDKAIRHYEAAAMFGHVYARNTLGCHEGNAKNDDLALQHWMISARLGHEGSLQNIKTLFMEGFATKAEYAEALRGYQNAIEETSSPERDEAKLCPDARGGRKAD